MSSRLTESTEIRVPIKSGLDVVVARQKARDLAKAQGFSSTDAAIVATAISELARNIVLYARCGEIILKPIQESGPSGIRVMASDKGPGIPDVEQAMHDGYSTSGGLGLGLGGVRRLMDEFEIVSEVGHGTRVTVAKWKR